MSLFTYLVVMSVAMSLILVGLYLGYIVLKLHAKDTIRELDTFDSLETYRVEILSPRRVNVQGELDNWPVHPEMNGQVDFIEVEYEVLHDNH